MNLGNQKTKSSALLKQNATEYWAVATRPLDMNGLGMIWQPFGKSWRNCGRYSEHSWRETGFPDLLPGSRRLPRTPATEALQCGRCYDLVMAVSADVFNPDLIVMANDGTDLVLVVEAKQSLTRLADTESQLRQYMLAMRCPVGLLATVKALRLYYDQYLSAGEDSVKLIGDYPAPSVWAKFEDRNGAPEAAAGFEDVVRAWLEDLTTESGLRTLSRELREAAELYLLLVLNQGSLRAAHPRAA